MTSSRRPMFDLVRSRSRLKISNWVKPNWFTRAYFFLAKHAHIFLSHAIKIIKHESIKRVNESRVRGHQRASILSSKTQKFVRFKLHIEKVRGVHRTGSGGQKPDRISDTEINTQSLCFRFRIVSGSGWSVSSWFLPGSGIILVQKNA